MNGAGFGRERLSSRAIRYMSPRCIRPAIGRFEQAHLLEPEVVAIAILIGCIKYAERGEREIFCCWRHIQHDRFVVFEGLKKLQ